jgi:hypothetical protein
MKLVMMDKMSAMKIMFLQTNAMTAMIKSYLTRCMLHTHQDPQSALKLHQG